MKDAFHYFDYGMIVAGLIIVLLNMNWLKFLRLNEQMLPLFHILFFSLSYYTVFHSKV